MHYLHSLSSFGTLKGTFLKKYKFTINNNMQMED